MELDFVLPTALWTSFAETTWDRHPMLLKRVFPEKIGTTDEVFQMMKLASQNYRITGLLPSFEFCINGNRCLADLDDYLVAEQDSAFCSYCRRLTSRPDINEFCLQLRNCQVYSPDLWIRVRRFLSGLYSIVGLPGSHTDMDIFCGNYRTTPIGIHLDTAANFTFVIEGRKSMAFWPSSTFAAGSPGTGEISRFPKDRIILEAEPGDLLFWPPQYWHTAFSERAEWTMTLNLHLFLTRSPLEYLSDGLALNRKGRHVIEAFKSRKPRRTADPSAVPDELKEELGLYREILNDRTMEDAVSEWWVRRASASGFSPVPAKKPMHGIGGSDVLSRFSEFPVVILRLENGGAIIGANGHSLFSSSYEKIAPLVSLLNSVSSGRVSDLCDEIGGNAELRLLFFQIISELESCGVFTVTRASDHSQVAQELNAGCDRTGA